jgi:hypothetical protein
MKQKSKADDDIIAEANARYARCLAFEADNLREAKDDFRSSPAITGQKTRSRQREVERRPCITINKLPAFLAHGNERPAAEQARHQGAPGR